nr:filamentous hemagglutinin N-terminal domain-containing protein [uncultured Cupriavidus sp.]
MNKNLFRRVFNRHLGMLVAVAENVKGQGKRTGETRAPDLTGERGVISTLTAIALALLAFDAMDARAQALPTGGQVVAGQATIAQPNASTMHVDQSSQRAVIDWNTFSIGQDQTVQFNQPNGQAQMLNRVTGADASNIQGSLLANGQVLIQNANGVLFGKGAVVNVGSLLATNKLIDAKAFMHGDPLRLTSTGTQAGVINEGDIQAQGFVTLMGDQVRNDGRIRTSQGGQVVLAAGDSATVSLPNGLGISLVLDQATANALVENTGHIVAHDGTVLVTARGKDTLLNTVINLDGVTRAGTIVADAGTTGDTVVTGQIDASNMAAGGQGGTVVLAGDRVGIFGDATVDVSGDAAGGVAILGGDTLHQLDGTQALGLLQDGMAFASHTQVDSGARVRANAAHGDGGFVETSGSNLDVQGLVTAAGQGGKAGHWLIDPTDITISTGPDAGYTGGVTGGFAAAATKATVTNTTISNALNAGTDVTITTASASKAAGSIMQLAGADITKTSGGDATLNLIADSNITLKGNITSTSAGLNLNAQAARSGAGIVNQLTTSNIDLNGGQLHMFGKTSAGTAVSTGGLKNIGGGLISGTSAKANAVVINRGLTLVGNGTLDIHGKVTNTNGANLQGVLLRGNTILTGNSTLNINAQAVSGPGLQMSGMVYVREDATFNAMGKGASGSGIWSSGNKLVVSERGSASLTGVTNTSAGVVVGMILSDDAKVRVEGASRTDDGAVVAAKMTGNAAAEIWGTSDTYTGLVQNTGGFDLDDNATLTLTGTSRTGAGVVLNNDLLVSGQGQVDVDGTSTNGVGVGIWVKKERSVADEGSLNIAGKSESGIGVRMDNGMGLSVGDSGAVSVSGESVAGSGVRLSGAVSMTGTGSVAIAGESVSGTGFEQGANSAIQIGDLGSLDLSGRSVDGDGIYQGGKIAFTDGGSGYVDGTSTNGTGMRQTEGSSIEAERGTRVGVLGQWLGGAEPASSGDVSAVGVEVADGNQVWGPPSHIGNDDVGAGADAQDKRVRIGAYYFDSLTGPAWHLKAPPPMDAESEDATWAEALVESVSVDPDVDADESGNGIQAGGVSPEIDRHSGNS